MSFGKKRNTEEITQLVNQSKSFEISVSDLLRKSNRRAWIVTWCAIGLSLLLAGGYFFMIPLKKEVPYLVLADPQTGTSTVARINGDFSNHSVSTALALNKSYVAHFLVARESYDWEISNARDWNVVFSMAGATVANEYKNIFADVNPANPNRIWGQKSSVRIKINSIVLMDDEDPSTPPTGATVRFERILVDKQSGTSNSLDNKIATMTFSYKNNLQMSDELRIENPLGFQVTAYRVDNELVSRPVAITPNPSATQSLNSNSPSVSAPAQSASVKRGAP